MFSYSDICTYFILLNDESLSVFYILIVFIIYLLFNIIYNGLCIWIQFILFLRFVSLYYSCYQNMFIVMVIKRFIKFYTFISCFIFVKSFKGYKNIGFLLWVGFQTTFYFSKILIFIYHICCHYCHFKYKNFDRHNNVLL